MNLTKFLRDDGSFDVEGYRHACRVFFIAQEILVDLSSYPTATIAQEQPRLPPARPRLREPRQPAHVARRPVRQPTRGARSPAALTAIMCGHAYRASAEMAGGEGAVRRLREEPRADAARDAHAPRRGVRRSIARRRARADARTSAACEDWDDGGAPRRGARLPQRAGDRARADRDDRSADGLRHDRHRAGLRAREVQEARRRRLLQDRQPVRARARSGASATREREVQEIVAYISGTNTLLAAPHINRRTLKEKGLTDAELGEGRGGASRACSISTARSRRGSSARTTYERLGVDDGDARAARASRCSSTWASRAAQIERGERRHRRPHDDRGRAAPARRSTTRSSTARTAAARRASASSRR